MNVNPTDKVLHLSFDDVAFARADVFAGQFNKREVSNKLYKPLSADNAVLPFKDKEFDMVYSSNVLAYVASPEKVFTEIRRICKRAYIKERSVFAEMIFGWPQTRWLIDIENSEFVIKAKNPMLVGRFGPLFHGFYQNDPSFFEACKQNIGLLNVAVDWFDSDSEIDGKISLRPCSAEYVDESRFVLGKISDKIDVRHMIQNK